MHVRCTLPSKCGGVWDTFLSLDEKLRKRPTSLLTLASDSWLPSAPLHKRLILFSAICTCARSSDAGALDVCPVQAMTTMSRLPPVVQSCKICKPIRRHAGTPAKGAAAISTIARHHARRCSWAIKGSSLTAHLLAVCRRRNAMSPPPGSRKRNPTGA